jgi:P-type Cu+ transporter
MTEKESQEEAHSGYAHAGLARTSAKDPVCGMAVDPSRAAGSHEHGGRTYHFCSRHCLEKFRTDPDEYLGRDGDARSSGASTPLATQSAAPAGPIYTCPMHPEVKQDHPGTCPKCGLGLEPLGGTSTTRIEYTCPMHPEVVSDHPGNCPKCGMTLEPRTVALDEGPNPELEDMARRFWACLALTTPLLVVAMAEMIPGQPLSRVLPGRAMPWVEFVLATPVVFWGGGRSSPGAGPRSSTEARICSH